MEYWRQLSAVMQIETTPAEFRPMLGMLAQLGIEQGKPFNPDTRTKRILEEAARIAEAEMRVDLYASRESPCACQTTTTAESGICLREHRPQCTIEVDLNQTFDATIAMRPSRTSPKMDRTKPARLDLFEIRIPRNRPKARFLLGFLLLTMCVLFLHLRAAKDRCNFLPNTTHVVHGDLEVETERPARVFVRVVSSSPVAARAVLANSPILASADAFHSLVHPFLAVCGLTKIRLMRHLARLFRAPPAL